MLLVGFLLTLKTYKLAFVIERNCLEVVHISPFREGLFFDINSKIISNKSMRREHRNNSPKNSSAAFISSKEAAELFGYTPDYISKLAREKKIVAKLEKRRWLVNPESVKLFVLESEAQMRHRQDEMRREQKKEVFQSKLARSEAESVEKYSHSASLALGLTVALFAIVSLLGGVSWVAYSEDLDMRAFALGGVEVKEMFSDLLPESWTRWRFVREDELPVVDNRGVVLLPEEASEAAKESVRQQFSDEVEVDFVDDDSGVITPVFKTKSDESYQFVLVPVHDTN